MLSLCGLVKGDAPVSVSRAFELSRIPGLGRGDRVMRRFRRGFSLEVRVKFLGVWDTVGALGIPSAKWLAKEQPDHHKVEMQEIVDHTRHALALDEHRRKFAPAIWEPRRPEEMATTGRTLEQRWFIGSHANVGGGYARDGLCLRPLQWMLDEAASRGLALRQRVTRLDDVFYASLPRDPLGEIGLGAYFLTQRFRRVHRPVVLGGPSRQTLDYTVLERWLWDPVSVDLPSPDGPSKPGQSSPVDRPAAGPVERARPIAATQTARSGRPETAGTRPRTTPESIGAAGASLRRRARGAGEPPAGRRNGGGHG